MLAMMLFFSGCQTGGNSTTSERPSQTVRYATPANHFNVPGQIVTSDLVRSLQLHRTGSPSSSPILRLNSNQQLNLQFDMLEFGSKQFRVRFTHHNPDWSRSSLPEEFFIDGFYNLFIDVGQVSSNQHPSYRQYTFQFPNQSFSFTRSGNYMLHVEDQDTGYLLFSIPFFIYENEGSITSSVETRTTPRQDLRIQDRLISRYDLPDFVDQPQFDLEFYFTQNRFWGRNKKAAETDFSSPVEVQFELSQNQAFTGDYEFNRLSLTDISRNNPQISEYDPSEIPPRVTIFDDAQGFSSPGPVSTTGRFGNPGSSLNAGYANVVFRLDPHNNIPADSDVYLTGDFNNWAIQQNTKMTYNRAISRWETSTIIKEGVYNYKYILVENGRLDDLYFDDLFVRGRQEYHAFVYMRDSQQFYYRLLQVNHFFSNP